MKVASQWPPSEYPVHIQIVGGVAGEGISVRFWNSRGIKESEIAPVYDRHTGTPWQAPLFVASLGASSYTWASHDDNLPCPCETLAGDFSRGSAIRVSGLPSDG